MQVELPDASALRFLVGHDLKTARENARITQSAAAKKIGCTPAKLSYMESGKTAQAPDEVGELMRYYRAKPEQVELTVSLAVRADHGTLSTRHADALPDWFKLFVGLERLADSQFEYSTMFIPGQLQTPEHAAALLADSLHIPPMDTAQAVRARMERQRLTDDAHPLKLQAVIEESVLDRPLGSPAVMIEQLEHLLTMTELDTVDLRVIPTTAGAHEGSPGAFILLNFNEARSIAYVEHHTGALYLQDRADVELYKMTADRLVSRAFSGSDTAQAISSRITKLKKMEQ
ncbi:helix-turn-helix domain-containing protein [Nocardia cyriacigeorgica]|uniref:helix-turn-helix domain-containing protein n=1 Tax=Nocardia cyriacigeorgica TaxID=135487 RepID=UPI001894358C|nr:helix-turn-helix transcriptional regulator [Nocardia cyriacigeorgica]MBF6085151.1 helix-turn-helix domain-containing protein [Nocardia cyriacigeorgica]